MKVTRNAVLSVLEVVLAGEVKKATKYLSESLTVTATRRFKQRKNERQTEVLLTIGKPNYAAREFIKRCKKAGEPFPVKKVHLFYWPKAKPE